MGPYGPLAAVILILAGSIGSFFYGLGIGEDKCTARGARDEQIRQRTFEDAQKGTAHALAQVEIKHTTINHAVEREVRTRRDYSACSHSVAGVRLINQALAGEPDAARDRELPAASAPAR